MKKEELNPYVRFFNKVMGTRIYNKMICAYDYRLFYIIKGRITFEFEDCCYSLTSGDVTIIKPGIAYKLNFEKDKDIEYFLINFDFVFDERYRAARTPVESKLFDENQIFSKSCIEPFNEVFILSNCLGIESELKEMYEININDHEEQALLRSALMKKILVKIIIKNKTLSGTNKNAKLIQNIKDYIYKNSDKKLTNMSVANHFGYHPYYLNNLFSSYENITLHNYINKIRIITAKEKLSLTDKPISVISCEMGFADCSYFSAFFRKTTGTTPKEYRNLCK